MSKIEKHFVKFYSPGTFVAETTEKTIDSWDIETAKKMAAKITERYNATPYAFKFTTRSREDKDLDSHVTKTSPMYYLNCKVVTLAEIKKRNDPKDSILISNMEGNGWDKVVQSTKGWQWTQPLEKGDVVL
jgi:hypothetical protein